VNRIASAFERLRGSREPGLIPYITAGDPDLARTEEIMRGLPGAGADLIEVGVPFSDPVADGPIIQRACERALRSGTTLEGVLAMVTRIRKDLTVPIVLFTYTNPVVRLGVDAFVARASDAGIDGVLVVDLPIDEAGPLAGALTRREVSPIFLVSPTTTPARIERAVAMGSGFLYAVARLGVTGTRDAWSTDAAGVVHAIRSVTAMPVALGFGVTTPAHVSAACAMADAAVVGSALVQIIAEAGGAPDVADRVAAHVRWLKSGVPA
jgi:tryptophan synthase alpha chain